MDACCEASAAALQGRQSRVLKAVLAVNLAMFVVEATAGVLAGSSALWGDSLDMLGDSLVYGFSLYVLRRGPVWRARAAIVKGAIMVGFGLWVLVHAGIRASAGVPPVAPIVFATGALALLANTACFLLLWRHRADDVNLRSTWLCSRNDLFANAAVLVSAGLVTAFDSVWPDVLVGAGIALLFLRTAASVFRESLAELSVAQERDASGGAPSAKAERSSASASAIETRSR